LYSSFFYQDVADVLDIDEIEPETLSEPEGPPLAVKKTLFCSFWRTSWNWGDLYSFDCCSFIVSVKVFDVYSTKKPAIPRGTASLKYIHNNL